MQATIKGQSVTAPTLGELAWNAAKAIAGERWDRMSYAAQEQLHYRMYALLSEQH